MIGAKTLLEGRGWAWALTRALLLVAAASTAAAGQGPDVLRRAAVYEPYMREAATREGVDYRLLWTIGYLETKFRPGLRSPAGARGLMQFMPATARRFGLENPDDPVGSIEAAARYVRFLERRFGRPELILAGYNSGELAVEAYLTGQAFRLPNGRVINPRGVRNDGVPEYRETRAYVSDGMRVMAALGRAPAAARLAQAVNEGPSPQRGLIRASLYFTAGWTVPVPPGQAGVPKTPSGVGENVPVWLRPTSGALAAASGKVAAAPQSSKAPFDRPAEQPSEPRRKQPPRSLFVSRGHEPGEN